MGRPIPHASAIAACFVLVLSLSASDTFAQGEGRASPEIRALIRSLSSGERENFFALSRDEKRAFIRKRLQSDAGAKKRGRIYGSRESGGVAAKKAAGGTEAGSPLRRVTPGLYFMDAHSQMDQNLDEERVVSLMDRGGIYRTILSTHMRRPWSDIAEFGEKMPNRIVPAVQIKGRGYHGKAPFSRFCDRLNEQVNHGGFRAMAEVLLWHDAAGEKYQEIMVDFGDELVQAAFQDARRKGWLFIVHIEFASLTEDGRRSYMEKLEVFLRGNPDQPFVMIHRGQLEAGSVRLLLDAHGNLHFMTSHASPSYQGGVKPFINMFDDDGGLKPEWRNLIADHPDRFVFALDNVFSRFWTPDQYLANMELWWRALSRLPDRLAQAVAHGNAERLWKLAPKRPAEIMTPPWISEKRLGPVTGYSAGRMRR